jgi:DnaK suppressor protein
MTQEKKEQLKKRLEDTKISLEAEIKNLETPIDVGDFPGEDDNADESTATFNQRSEATPLREVLTNVESAISKIEEGTYGICENCGQEISQDLLDIAPEAKLCQSCNKKNVVKT